MKQYNPNEIEKKWQKVWEDSKINKVDIKNSENPFYNLMMFPYPSAEGLHIGSVYTFSGVDTFGRFNKMKGSDVFEPIGLDGFGIHSENYAIKIGEHIRDVSQRTEKHFYEQMKETGNMYDWSRSLETYDPDYYKWTQWLFKTLYEAGLAYRKHSKVNWCPSCKTVLSDEQVIDGHCERCDNEVIKKDMKQWFFKITDYAERLNNNLDWIKWDNDVKIGQKNWIGRSVGAQIKFKVKDETSKIEDELEVYTTAHDTIFGATFMVIAPEHELIEKFGSSIRNLDDVQLYIKQAINKSDLERTDLNKDKTGIKLEGVSAINPANGEELPIFVADYVLVSYGTGAIMAVPGHDERDYEFANKYNIPVVYVVEGNDEFLSYSAIKQSPNKYRIINSGKYNGLDYMEGRELMLKDFDKQGFAVASTNYRLRDWTVSRQRYWGPPIPMVQLKDSEKVKIFAVHGTNADGKSNWFPWLEKEMKEKEIEFIAPDFPDTKAPNYDERMKFIEENYSEYIDENTIIIGHSSGAATALHIAEKYKVKELVLVGPYVKTDEFDEEILLREGFAEESVEGLKEFTNRGLDYSKINENTNRIVVFYGKNDPYVDISHVQLLDEEFEGLVIKIFDKKAHFSIGTDKTSKLDELLIYIDNENWISVDESSLPVLLPDVLKFEDILPDGSGKGPLEKQKEFVDVSNEYGEGAKRETDVSDPFVDSCWYFLRYPFTDNKDQPFEFVERPMFGEEVDQDPKVLEIFDEIYYKFENAGLYPMAVGSLMLTGLNGKSYKKIKDIDMTFSSEENLQKAIEIMIDAGASKLSTTNGITKLNFDGVEIELGSDGKDSYLGYKVNIFDQKYRILDPKVMRKRYVEMGKDSDDIRFQILDNWLNQPINKWFPITWYIGGKEHTVLHLLYARFITMVLNDLGLIDFEEPFLNFYGHGLITKDGAKMSKSKGNVINPDEYFEKYGADPIRMYLRFIGPFDQGGDWRDTGMKGMKKFVSKMWEILQKFVLHDIDNKNITVKINKLHKTVKGVTEDLENLKYNTAVAKLMELINWYKENEESFDKEQIKDILEKLILMLAPFMPHTAEEMWEVFNKSMDSDWEWSIENSVHNQSWPDYDENMIQDDFVNIAVQVNGKFRGTVRVEAGSDQEIVWKEVIKDERILNYGIEENKKIIFVKDKIVNIIV